MKDLHQELERIGYNSGEKLADQTNIRLGDLNPFRFSSVDYVIRTRYVDKSGDSAKQNKVLRNAMLLGFYDGLTFAVEISTTGLILPTVKMINGTIKSIRVAEMERKAERDRNLQALVSTQ